MAVADGATRSGRADGLHSDARGSSRYLDYALPFLWSALVYVAVFWLVRQHYDQYLPHFDSMAGLFIATTMNIASSQGLAAGVARVADTSTGWIQPLYGLLLAWLPFRTPEWLTSLNFLLLLLAQVCIVNFGRAHGLSRARQLVMAALPLVPAVTSSWNGGLADLRRDSQLMVLVIALLFQSLAYARRPSVGAGVLLGVVAALTQWSRDNAAPVVAIVALPAVILAARRGWSAGGVGGVLRLGALPVLAFLVLIVPYYLSTLELTYLRYTTIVWGFGRDRLEMLQTAVDAPMQVLLGGRYASTSSESALLTAAFLVLAATGVGILAMRRQVAIRPRALLSSPYRELLVSGVWVIVGVVVYTSLVIGVSSAGLGMAMLPTAAGHVAILAGLLGAVTRRPTTRWAVAFWTPAVFGAAVSAIFLARIVVNETVLTAGLEPSREDIAAVRTLAVRLSDLAERRPVAVIWTEGLSRATINVYLAQAGRPPLLDFAARSTLRGDPIDLEQPIRPNDRPEELQARLDRTLRQYADFVVVCRDPAQYESSILSRLWPYQVGRPSIERLLADPDFVPVEEFTVRNWHFVILENRTSRG